MKLVVVGAGAMGSSVAAHAARAGHEVSVIDTSAEIVDQINHEGIVITAPEQVFTSPVTARRSPEGMSPVDVVILFVKAQHTEAAGRSLEPLLDRDTVVVTLQNGWGNADRLAQFIPHERIVVGVTYNSCTLTGPGRVNHSGRGPTVTGPYLGSDTGPAQKVASLLEESGWPAKATSAVRTEIWRKLVLNAATLPTSALTRLNAGQLSEPGEVLELVDRLASEATAVAVAQGLDVDVDERLTAIHTVLDGAGSGKPSMLQDVLAGRKTEIETVNGAVVQAGNDHNVPVPLNTAMVALVHGLERMMLQ